MNGETRTSSSVKNVSYGFIITILNTLTSFVSRTVLIKTLGNEIIALNGLFTEVISILSLTELGVGMAIVYSLYKPISDKDEKKISQLMSLYKTAYNVIAVVMFVIGLIITFFIDRIITDIYYPISYIRIIFILFVIKNASSYLFSYKTALLNADQKQYIISLVTAIVNIFVTAIMVVTVILFRNYILYLIIMIIQSLFTNVVLSVIVNKKYSFINYKERLPKEERREIFLNIKNIFIKRVSGVITDSTDNILISVLISTIQVGLYSNYVMMFSVVRIFKQQLINGIAASIGNLSVTENSEHCVCVLKRLTYLFYVFGLIIASGFMAVSKEFICMWIGEKYIMSDIVIYISVFILFLDICADPLWQFLEVSGLFKQDKNIAIIGSVINLIVSVVLGTKIGIAGIFIGTVCTQGIQIILKIWLIFKKKFEFSPKEYYVEWVKMLTGYILLIACQIMIISKLEFLNYFLGFLVKGTLSVIIANVIAILIFYKTEEIKYMFEMLQKVIKCLRR